MTVTSDRIIVGDPTTDIFEVAPEDDEEREREERHRSENETPKENENKDD